MASKSTKRRTKSTVSRARATRDLPSRKADAVKGGGVKFGEITVTKPTDTSSAS
ncbi:MAG TPA: hypothetical protein VFJ24_06430 [Gaiellales bacterium]|nr:hypothetical protein [Gaiellales bacterium]